jgi:formate dehydrogenase iron-sulfur subunit
MSRQTVNSKLSRRAFLKQVGVGATAMVAAHLLSGQASPARASTGLTAGHTWGMLIDLTRCAGCNSCALACKAVNDLPNADEEPPGLSSEAYTFVDTRRVTMADGQTETRTVKRQCMHCLDAACVSACPAAAMYKSEEGPVIYRAERCLGCRYCQMACPFEVPSFEWENGITPVISKCWMCYARLQEGEKPACAEACPTGALRFGRRDELLAQAHAQIDCNCNRYVNHIFGEHEVGGTSMLYLSDIPFEELGFPVGLPESAPPEETEKIMNTLPFVITGVAALMAGTATYTHRKSAHYPDEQEA